MELLSVLTVVLDTGTHEKLYRNEDTHTEQVKLGKSGQDLWIVFTSVCWL